MISDVLLKLGSQTNVAKFRKSQGFAPVCSTMKSKWRGIIIKKARKFVIKATEN